MHFVNPEHAAQLFCSKPSNMDDINPRRLITLEELKGHKEGALQGMKLLTMPRLSVQPVGVGTCGWLAAELLLPRQAWCQ